MKKTFSFKNILVMRNDRFGEFLLIIPALRGLKESFPGAKITLMVSPYLKELAGCVEYADEIIVWENKKHTLREVFSFGIKLKKRKFDLAVIFNPSKEAHLLSFLAGIPKRVGYNRKWGILLNLRIKDEKHLAEKHEVEYNLGLVNLIEVKTSDKTISLGRLPKQGNVEYAGAIALHPFTSDPVKQWPIERFKELAQRIVRELKVKVVFVGKVESEIGIGKGIGRENPEIIDLINKTSLAELAQVLKQCKLLVTCDSGPMHLAAAVGTPVVALFRNDLPGKTAKRWGPWGEGHVVIEKSSLNDISVEEVLCRVKERII